MCWLTNRADSFSQQSSSASLHFTLALVQQSGGLFLFSGCERSKYQCHLQNGLVPTLKKEEPPPISLVYLLKWKIEYFHFTFSAGYRRVAATAERGNLRAHGVRWFTCCFLLSLVRAAVCVWNISDWVTQVDAGRSEDSAWALSPGEIVCPSFVSHYLPLVVSDVLQLQNIN